MRRSVRICLAVALAGLGGCAVGAAAPVDDPRDREPSADTDAGARLDARDDGRNGGSRSPELDASLPGSRQVTSEGETGGSTPAPADAGEAPPEDECPDDPTAVEMGPCGCGSDETDSDDDGTPDCADGCPDDPNAIEPGTCEFPFEPSNLDPTYLDFDSAPNWTCTAPGTTVVDSAAGSVTSASCTLGALDVLPSVSQLEDGSPKVMVVRLRKLLVGGGHVLHLTGDRPIVLLVNGDVSVIDGGVIDAGAQGATPGPGGNLGGDWCAGSSGADAETVPDNHSAGGGGGGFGSGGGAGGVGKAGAYPGGSAGATSGDDDLVPLRGGCAGGLGGNSSNAAAGAGGGAFQISAAGAIVVGNDMTKGTITVHGGGGLGQPDNADCNGDGGDGGGSGGAILLEALAMPVVGTLGALRAHGGAGGGATNCGASQAGEDGHGDDDVPAAGGTGNGARQTGGTGGLCAGEGCDTASALGLAPEQDSDWAGAGGGGGGGRIVLRASP